MSLMEKFWCLKILVWRWRTQIGRSLGFFFRYPNKDNISLNCLSYLLFVPYPDIGFFHSLYKSRFFLCILLCLFEFVGDCQTKMNAKMYTWGILDQIFTYLIHWFPFFNFVLVHQWALHGLFWTFNNHDLVFTCFMVLWWKMVHGWWAVDDGLWWWMEVHVDLLIEPKCQQWIIQWRGNFIMSWQNY